MMVEMVEELALWLGVLKFEELFVNRLEKEYILYINTQEYILLI